MSHSKTTATREPTQLMIEAGKQAGDGGIADDGWKTRHDNAEIINIWHAMWDAAMDVQKVSDPIQPTKPLSQREREALADIAILGRPYTWKQASMRKLEKRGLVHTVGMRGDQPMWELTDEGKNHG